MTLRVTIQDMNLRDEILQSPRGIQADLVRRSGLSRQTVYRALYRIRCGLRAAQRISRAYGQPERWTEFFSEETAPTPQHPGDVAA